MERTNSVRVRLINYKNPNFIAYKMLMHDTNSRDVRNMHATQCAPAGAGGLQSSCVWHHVPRRWLVAEEYTVHYLLTGHQSACDASTDIAQPELRCVTHFLERN